MKAYVDKVAELQQQYEVYIQQNNSISLGKNTSNLFRHREQARARLDVRQFNSVITVDVEQGLAVVEGMTTYEDLVAKTLQCGCMPAVVPELKTITVGGALSGIGIESSSFRYGLVHETIVEFDVLLGDGKMVTCRADNEYSNLFFAFPNSYGTLGYALRVVIKTVPVKTFVKLTHRHFSSAHDYYQEMQRLCDTYRQQAGIDFIDGSVFSDDEMVITIGEFVDHAPYVSDYRYMNIYYRSIQNKQEDYLTTHDYIWRWDADWFWCSKVFYLQNPIVRFLLGKWMLKSRVYWKLKALAHDNKLLRWLQARFSKPTESVIQDVAIPIENAAAFFEFFNRDIGIKPFWNCPVRAYDDAVQYDFFKMEAGQLYINFGFWDMVPSDKEEGHFNRLVEQKVLELGGIKSLYSTVYYSSEEFWGIYDKSLYDRLKAKYDPRGLLKNLYDKCAERG